MNSDRLPPELQRLERELAARPRPQPSADLRDRIVGQMQSALVRNGLVREGSRNRWTFVVALAISVMLWMNLSLSATRATEHDLRFGGEPPSVAELTDELRRAAPELTEQEATRQAVLLRAGSNLAFCPDFAGRAALQRRADHVGEFLP